MEDNFNNHINVNNNQIIINVDDVFSNILTRKDAMWFAQQNGKFFIIILGLYLPNISCFDVDYLLQYASKKKNVSFLLYILF